MRNFLFFSFLFLGSFLFGQQSLILKANRDAALGYHDGANTANNNYGSAVQNAAYCIPSAINNGVNVNRALIDFDFSLLPSNISIISAHLNLYATGPVGTLAGHTGAGNAAYIERVTGNWSEYSVTWNSQPSTTATHRAILAASTSATQDYLNIDVTDLVKDILANSSPSNGLMIRLVNEVSTNALVFCSSDYQDTSKSPQLIIEYESSTCEMSLKISKDAAIGYHDGYNTANNNYGNAIQNAAYCVPSAAGNGVNVNRCLMAFDLSLLPSNVSILSARLNLYATGPLGGLQGHTGIHNTAYIERIINAWSDMNVTWNTQPTTTSLNSVTLPASSSATQDYLNIDVTALVKDIIADSLSDGMLIRLVNELSTNALLFCSADYQDPAKHPVLNVLYRCNNTTGLNEQETGNYFSAFPNPFRNQITLKFKCVDFIPFKMIVYNVEGQVISTEKVTNVSNGVEYVMEYSGNELPAGIYFVRVLDECGGKYFSQKICLMR